MRQTKLIEALYSLSARERSTWRQYIWSDYCNRHPDLRRLCDVLLAQAQHSVESLDKKRLFHHVFGETEPYNELKFNNLSSDLYERLLDWLSQEHQQKDVLEKQRLRVQVLLDRDLNKQAAAALEKYRTLLEQSPKRNANWYRHASHAEAAAETLHSRQPRRADSPHLLLQAQYDQCAQALEKLSVGLALRSRSNLAVIQAGGSFFMQHELESIRADHTLLTTAPAAIVYLAAFELLEKPAPASFRQLTDALEAHHDLFEKDETAALYQCALNYCIRCINEGQTAAYSNALALYRILLKKGLLLQRGGKLSQWTYKNIATTGLRSGEYQWTEQFLHQYRHTLPDKEQENAFAFNLASLYFEKNDFARTLETLQNVEFTDFTYHIGAKLLLLKTYYHLEETDALASMFSSTEQLLRRDKSLSAFGKATNLNFLRMLRKIETWRQKMATVSNKEAEKKRLALLEKLSRLQPVANKDWLFKILTHSK